MFAQFGSAILASYYMMMITGDSAPISSWVLNTNIIIMILMILFSFFTIIYLMNLFIGILGNLIGNTNHRIAYLALKKEIIVEIELFCLLPFQRRKHNWFPETFFYPVNLDEIRKIVQQVNSTDWNKPSKPYISKTLLKILNIEKQETEEPKKEIEENQINEIKILILESQKEFEKTQNKKIEDLFLELKNLLNNNET
ncbi:hypothetical protein C2G38_2078228 [Gigaspora rosea]|uniref:Ion transport domain-containing protein n=1 Tax=Gigaspora rosea TaxID=44941 RepID=A0A397VNJ4_9GLOM|nr:hypothetical protein C2G38_2078228 [Gigaspora rosea]